MSATITSNKECSVCGAKHTVTVPDELFNQTMVGLSQWHSGEYLIQDCLSFITPDDREILISGIGAECWKTLTIESESQEDPEYWGESWGRTW